MTEENNSSIKGLELSKSIYDEAALTYAGGNWKPATQIVLGAILDKARGNAKNITDIDEYKKNWFLGLDMFQALKQKNNFDSFSLLYSKFFGTTPPVYNENFLNSSKNHEQIGRTNLNIDIKISDINKSKILDFEKASITNKTSMINFSRSTIDKDNNETLQKLYILRNSMKKIRENKVQGVMMGETDFINKVKEIISEILVEYAGRFQDMPVQLQVYWIFLCELYQWSGMKEDFEKLSLEYSNLFKVTPPAFNPEQVMISDHNIGKEEDFFYDKLTKTFKLNKEITSIDIEKIKNLIKPSLDKLKYLSDSDGEKSDTNIILDFNSIIRVDFFAATQLALFLSQTFEEEENSFIYKNKIIIRNPFEFIIRLFDITGVSNYVTYQERNRNII